MRTLDAKLRKLRLGHTASILEVHHQTAINAKLGYLEFLESLIDDELNTRENKGLDKRIRAARFPVTKTLEEFDFAFQPSIDVMQIKALASCDFIAKHETALFIGPPGVGKSHLATAIGVKACLRGYDVLFAKIPSLASQLNSALADLSVDKLVERYVRADLIILDELGFTPLNKIVADHIFRIVSERYERGSIIVTSNKPFELWAETFADPTLAGPILDRLIHHAHIVSIKGDSYRTKVTANDSGEKRSYRQINTLRWGHFGYRRRSLFDYRSHLIPAWQEVGLACRKRSVFRFDRGFSKIELCHRCLTDVARSKRNFLHASVLRASSAYRFCRSLLKWRNGENPEVLGFSAQLALEL